MSILLQEYFNVLEIITSLQNHKLTFYIKFIITNISLCPL